jgi:hypothetical protein
MEIKWTELLVGAIISFLLSSIPSIIVATKLLIHDPYKMFYGSLFAAGYAIAESKDENKIKFSTVQIKKNFFGYPTVIYNQLADDGSVQYRYKGKLYYKESVGYIHMEGIAHSEDMFFVFNKPLVDFTVIPFLRCHPSPEYSAATSMSILSKKKLTKDEVKELLPTRRITILERGLSSNEMGRLILRDGTWNTKLGFTENIVRLFQKNNL